MLAGSGGQGPPNQRPPRNPSSMGSCCSRLFSDRIQTQPGSGWWQRSKGEGGPREPPPHCCPSQTPLCLHSPPLLCCLSSLAGEMLMGWGVEWEEGCLALRGAAEIYGTGFLQAGERPQVGAVEPDRGA